MKTDLGRNQYKEYSMDDLLNYNPTTWDKIISFIWYRPKNIISNRYYKIKYGIQRCFRGYDDIQVFEVFSEFTNRYIKILSDLRDNHNGHPPEITDEDYTNVLQHMVDCLIVIRDTDEFKEDGPNAIMQAKTQFMGLFNYWFFDLWD